MITRSTKAPIALRLALRELRGGVKGFRIFIACLFLGVTAIAAVGSLTRSITDGLAREGQSLLGGDIEIRLFQRNLTDETIQLLDQAGDVSVSSQLRTMTRSEQTGQSTLVEMRSVDDQYPLYGNFTTQPQMDLASLLEKRGESWGAAIDPLLADRLQLSVGDTIIFGSIKADIRAFVDQEPDKANLGFQLGPSVFVSREALHASGLVTVGSLINNFYKVRLDKGLVPEKVREDLKEAYPDENWRVRDRSDSAPGLRRFIEQMGGFLVIVGLAALAVGGVGVGNAVKGYMDRKTQTIATLKILGADGQTIFWSYFLQVMIIGLLATIAGIIVGAFLPEFLGGLLPKAIPVDITGEIYPATLAKAGLYGLLITVAFTAWPLGKARDLPAVRLFRSIVAPERRWPRKSYLALIFISAVIVGILAVGFAGDKTVAAGFILGTFGSLILLRLTSLGIEKLAAKTAKPKDALLRMALVNLYRPGAATGAVVISLGLGLTLFATIAMIESNLKSQLDEEVPSEAPAFFIVDLQPEQVDQFAKTAMDIDGVTDVFTTPNLRATITKLNGIPTKDWVAPNSDYRWVLRGDRGLSYGDNPGTGTTVVEGDWWPQGYAGEPEISFGRAEAEGLGLGIGDTVTLNILGREITATIRSLREINWGTFGFNFVMMFDPYTLKFAPHTYMATLKASGLAEEEAHRTLTREFPNITAVRMKELLTSLNQMMGQISGAIGATAAVAIIAGMLVLAGAIAAGFRQRVYESVILKVLGAVRKQVLWAYFLEYLFLGLITGVIALGLGLTASYLLVTQLWQLDFQFLLKPMIMTVGTGLLVTIIFGLLSSWQALSVRPYRVLRSE